MVRDGWVLGATALIYVFFFLRTVSAQQPGRYYTGAGGTSSTCSWALCPTCLYYQYAAGCTGTSPGTCTNCTNAVVGNYYTLTGGIYNLCQTTQCSCQPGYYNPTCANASQGTCIPLTNTPGYYYTSTTNWVTITQVAITSCTLPAYNVGSSSTSPGARAAPGTAPSMHRAARQERIWQVAAARQQRRARIAPTPLTQATNGCPTAGSILSGA